MDEKPKSALDWIRWARKTKDEQPDQVQPAPVPTGPAQTVPRAAAPEWTAAPKAAVQAPPKPAAATPASNARTTTKELEDLEASEDPAQLGDEDDFDRLMANVAAAPVETFEDPAPVQAAPEPIPEPEPEPETIPEPAAAPTAPQGPAASNSTVVIPGNSAYTFHPVDFGFVEEGGSEVTHVVIIALAGEGSLRFDHAAVSMGQKISVADIEAGKFAFIPSRSASAVGHDSFLFKVSDGTSSSRVAYTMMIQTEE